MAIPNMKPWIADDDIEAQLQDDFTHEAAHTCARMDPSGVLRWGFDKATSHLRCRKQLWRPLYRVMVDVPR
jgi:hypothetical protein